MCARMCTCVSSLRQIDKLIQTERVFQRQMVLVAPAFASWDFSLAHNWTK